MSTDEVTKPWGLKWRSSVWFVTAVVGLGITTDLLVYSIVVPVLPFRLQSQGYSGVSGLVGWLLFGYSGGLVLSTPVIATLSEKYNSRKYPLLIGQLTLIGSQILLMEAKAYWVMIIARLIQGISSAVIWVVGLALLCDTASESIVGRQLGLAMSGLSLGLLVGPPVGGTLYKALGYRSPFVCSVVIIAIDLVGRLLIMERKDAIRFGVDPAAPPPKPVEQETGPSDKEAVPECSPLDSESNPATTSEVKVKEEPSTDIQNQPAPVASPHRVTLMGVVRTLVRSPRALAVLFNTMIYGIVYTSLEPTLPLHLQDIWHLNSSGVGLVFLAAVIPTLFSSGLAGWWTDKKGPEWLTVSCLILSTPWWAVMIVQKSLALFIVSLALQSFFTSGVLSPLTAELAAVSRSYDGVGYGHVYGAFNLAYGIGSALGPLIGGQVYEHIKLGWLTVCVLAIGLFVVCFGLVICFTGEEPLLARGLKRYRARLLKHASSSASTNTPVTLA